MSAGFDRSELSLLAAEKTVDEKLGHRYQRIAELEDDPAVPRCFYVSKESVGDAEGGLIGGLMYVGAAAAAGAVVSTGGTLALVIAAAAVAGGVGGLLGSLIAKSVGDQHARRLQEQLDYGGLLLWIRTRNEDREKREVEILSSHSGQDVHVHSLPLPACRGESVIHGGGYRAGGLVVPVRQSRAGRRLLARDRSRSSRYGPWHGE